MLHLASISKGAKKIVAFLLCVMLLGLTVTAYSAGTSITLSMSGYKQTTSYTCGSASALMVLYFCGQRDALEANGITRDQNFHDTYRVDTRTKGIQIADIATGLNDYLGSGTYRVNYSVSSSDELVNIVTNSLQLYRPVIASVYWYGGHYVVIYGIYYENGTAYYRIKDPVKSAGETLTKKASDFFNSMPYPNNNNAHIILYGTTRLNYEPSLSISGAAYPSGKITANQSFELKGKITSNETITAVYGSIYYLKDNTLVPKSMFSTNTNPAKITPNKTSVEIYNTAINTGLKFGQLPEEAYRYQLSAVTSSGYSKTLVDSTFTVGSFVLATGVTMDQSSLSINPGKTASLSASISPSNATKKTLSWYSDDPSVATVDSNGNVTGVSTGTTEIIAETIDGSNALAYCSVQVKPISGKWGKLSWKIGNGGVLTVSGSGAMKDFDLWDSKNAWRPYADEIKKVVIKSGVTSIGDYAFGDCPLTSVSIPDSVTSIGFTSFYNCGSLTSITIPESVTSIGSWCFGSCLKLNSVTINGSITEIGEYTFYGCGKLTGITIPASVKTIAGHAFDASGLTSVGIPSKVKTIGENAFSNCTGLVAMKIPNSVSSIGANAFENTNVRIYCYDGSAVYKYAKQNGILYYLLNNPYTDSDFVTPANLTAIGAETFRGIKARRIKLNESMTKIESNAFYGCSNLIQIYIPASCTSIASNAFSNPGKITIFGKAGSYAETYAMENGIAFATSGSISERIRQYILQEVTAYDPGLDLNRDGVITQKDYILARKTGL